MYVDTIITTGLPPIWQVVSKLRRVVFGHQASQYDGGAALLRFIRWTADVRFAVSHVSKKPKIKPRTFMALTLRCRR